MTAWWLVVAGVAAGVSIPLTHPPSEVIALMSEDGPVEVLTAIALLAVAPAGRLLRRRADPVAHSVAAFTGAILIAKGLDRRYSVLTEDVGWPLSTAVQAAVHAIEECLELTPSAIALLALWQNHRRESPLDAP